MTVVSISLTTELLEKLDEFVERSNYSSRSEAIRVAVRDILSQFAMHDVELGRVMATVTVIYETEQSDISVRLTEFRHAFEENIFGNMHLHIGGGFCVEIFILQGDRESVLRFVTRVRAVRGIREVKYTLTPIEGSNP